jgi:hypothetical protein
MFFLDRRYGFFTRPARARFSCTVRKLRVRQALGHSGVGIIIYLRERGNMDILLLPYMLDTAMFHLFLPTQHT